MDMREFAKRFDGCTRDGDVFDFNGKQYMRVTWMVAESIDGNELYMKGFDF